MFGPALQSIDDALRGRDAPERRVNVAAEGRARIASVRWGQRSARRHIMACAALVLVTMTVGGTMPSIAQDTKEARNEQIVRAFYEAGLNRKDFAAASAYLGPKYIQHNPKGTDGAAGFAQFVEYYRKNYPQAHNEIRRTFADGDFVILHIHERLQPDDRGNAIVDIFRLENGRIVEHWDVKQAIPDQSANNNGMF